MNCLETNEDEKFIKYALKYLEEIPDKDRRPGKYTDWFLYHAVGLKLHEQGKQEKALEYYQKAISKESHAETFSFIGQAHKDLGNEKQAISYWRTAAKMGYGQAIMALNSRGIDI
ncbi:MAG: hypothetical protein RI573_04810 [Balneolaceae bacterium]|nr:hypothetical protein [Balneolaceae bacterium]